MGSWVRTLFAVSLRSVWFLVLFRIVKSFPLSDDPNFRFQVREAHLNDLVENDFCSNF